MKPRVFISSTCYDLLDLRAELKDFLVKLGLSVSLSDHSDSDFEVLNDENSIGSCLVNIKNSDVAIFVLSQRYGPRLKDYGNVSATHLEYKTIVQHNADPLNKKIKVVFFVRDKLVSDSDIRRRNKGIGDVKLTWIKPENEPIIDFFEEHNGLNVDNRNNWYWPFRDSLDIKERLLFELKDVIKNNRLNTIIEGGEAPFFALNPRDMNYRPDIHELAINLMITNMGNQPAIDPIFLIITPFNIVNPFESDDYYRDSVKYAKKRRSLTSNDNVESEQCTFAITGMSYFFIEIMYKTIFGDVISDIFEAKIIINPSVKIMIFFKGKKAIDTKTYEEIALRSR